MIGKRIYFYVIKKDYLEKVGINNINWSTDKNIQKLNVITAGTLASSDQYSAIDVDLKLAQKEQYVFCLHIKGNG